MKISLDFPMAKIHEDKLYVGLDQLLDVKYRIAHNTGLTLASTESEIE
jgi:hypothetical protein